MNPYVYKASQIVSLVLQRLMISTVVVYLMSVSIPSFEGTFTVFRVLAVCIGANCIHYVINMYLNNRKPIEI